MFNVLNLLAKCTQLHLEERNARKIFGLKNLHCEAWRRDHHGLELPFSCEAGLEEFR